MRLEQIRAGLLLYRYYFVVSALFTVLFCFVYIFTQHDAVAALAGKTATTSVTLFFIRTLRNDTLYYYYNMHISKPLLASCYILADMLVFILCLWITHRFL